MQYVVWVSKLAKEFGYCCVERESTIIHDDCRQYRSEQRVDTHGLVHPSVGNTVVIRKPNMLGGRGWIKGAKVAVR